MRTGAIAVAFALLSFTSGALAQSPAQLRAAERLLDALQFDQYLTAAPGWNASRIPRLGELLNHPEMQRQIADARARMQAGMPKIRAQVARFLAERFSERELNELRRQFRTPAGAKFARAKSAFDFEVGMAALEQVIFEAPEIKKALQGEREASERRKVEFEALLGRAERGEAAAQQQVSQRYCSGSYPDSKGKVDPENCSRYRLLAAEGGDTTAQYALATQNLVAIGGKSRDPQKGFEWLQKAAEGGNIMARVGVGRLMLGYTPFDTGTRPSGMPELVNPAEGERTLRPLAESGNVGAIYTLADAYLTGTGVAKNPAEAANMLRLSADKGNRLAMQRLGDLYYEGTGVPRNLDESVRWYRLSLGKK